MKKEVFKKNKRFKEIRKSYSKTQVEWSHELHLSLSTIKKIETHKIECSDRIMLEVEQYVILHPQKGADHRAYEHPTVPDPTGLEQRIIMDLLASHIRHLSKSEADELSYNISSEILYFMNKSKLKDVEEERTFYKSLESVIINLQRVNYIIKDNETREMYFHNLYVLAQATTLLLESSAADTLPLLKDFLAMFYNSLTEDSIDRDKDNAKKNFSNLLEAFSEIYDAHCYSTMSVSEMFKSYLEASDKGETLQPHTRHVYDSYITRPASKESLDNPDSIIDTHKYTSNGLNISSEDN